MVYDHELEQTQADLAAAAVVVGTLATAALALFVVLEIQWIRFWGLRIKTERRSLVDS